MSAASSRSQSPQRRGWGRAAQRCRTWLPRSLRWVAWRSGEGGSVSSQHTHARAHAHSSLTGEGGQSTAGELWVSVRRVGSDGDNVWKVVDGHQNRNGGACPFGKQHRGLPIRTAQDQTYMYIHIQKKRFLKKHGLRAFSGRARWIRRRSARAW